MKKIIFFFGSFDPLHKGHISILENAIKQINADLLYIGLNKNSNKGKLTPLIHRKSMVKFYCANNKKCKLLPFAFDYTHLEQTYNKIFSLSQNNDSYILVGQDQLHSLEKWHNYDFLIRNFSFIIAKRADREIEDKYLNNPKYIFIDHKYKNISSFNVKNGEYQYTEKTIARYIVNHNLYLKEQIKQYLSSYRYEHSISLLNTALLINKKAKLNIDTIKIEKAALLHDIAKEIDIIKSKEIMERYFPNHLNENFEVFHQYIGEYLAKEKFHIDDLDILNAIKYHTTGRANMSLLEKLIYISDKIEPTRKYDSTNMLKLCCSNFEEGFTQVLKNNLNYLKNKKIKIDNPLTNECINYYL